MDNHATTPVDPRVLEAMLPYFTRGLRQRRQPQPRLRLGGREGGRHGARAGRRADRRARPRRSSSPAARPSPTTSRSRAWPSSTRTRATTSSPPMTEHKAVLDTCKALERKGLATVTYLPVDKDGHGRPGRPSARRSPTRRSSSRSCSPTTRSARSSRSPRSARSCRERGVLFHSDAVQGVGKLPFDVDAMQRRPAVASPRTRCTARRASARSTCAEAARPPRADHRRRRARARHALGHAERARHRRLRQGGRARRTRAWPTRRSASLGLRERLHDGIFAELDEVYLNGHPVHRLPGNLNVCFAFVEGEALLMGLKARRTPIAASAVAARDRGVVGLGLHVGDARAVVRAAGARRRRRAGAHLDPLRPRPLQHARKRSTTSSTGSCTRCGGSATCRRSTRWRRKASTSKSVAWQRE